MPKPPVPPTPQPPRKSSKSNAANRSAQRPKRPVRPLDTTDLVLTPGGLRPRSLVHRLEPGQHVSTKGGRVRIIETATGRVVKDLGESAKPGDSEGDHPHVAPAIVPSLPDIGWIENSQWRNGGTDPIVYFSTTWVVPPAPSSSDNQIIFLFNGMQPDSAAHILQPVLQWGSNGAFGGNYWCITNWYADGQGGAAVYGTSQPQVNPGDVLQGVMTCTGQSGTEFNYTSSFVGYPAADVTQTDVDELTWAYETLECYGSNSNLPLTQCSDYPNTPLTAMYDIEIKTGTPGSSGTDAAIDWFPVTSFTDCGQNCLIVSNDSPGGAVYLYYQQPTQNFYFIVDKGTFGLDEVKDVIAHSGGIFSAAFWLAVEGFTVQQLTIDQPSIVWPTIEGTFSSLQGVNVAPSATYAPVYDSSNLYLPQRILFPFDITFTSQAYGDFPPSGETAEELNGYITIAGTALPQAAAVFYLVAGADPYFTNIDPSQNNVFYLSQDLRVFTITPEVNNTTPVGNVKFTFQTGGPTTLDTAAAYTYIRDLLGYFNATYSNPGGADPFSPNSSVLPGQSGALTGDSSVTPATPNPANQNAPFNNYNFALARVRLRGSSGTSGEAANVRVFFRLFGAQTNDTDYINTSSAVSSGDPYITYPSSPANAPNAPTSPLPGTDSSGAINGCTIPFFAADDQSDLQDGGVNNQTIEIPMGDDQVWTYFGCFLNVYDPTYLVGGHTPQYWLAGGTHHCIVAQIAFGDAPIENSNGVIENPQNSNQLAQRNLQVTASGNPGFPVTHRIPQTFDIRPSPAVLSGETGYLLNYPDELMIDWGNTPGGSVASIYWPQVSASDVLQLAAELYPSQPLSAFDDHTVQCEVLSGMTYIPIPTGAGENFAGLITIDLPAGVRAGNEFDIVVRRVTSRRPQQIFNDRNFSATGGKRQFNWRYVVGAFQMKVPVERDAAILPPEENLLAILRWRLLLIDATNRWYPVLQRYISYVAARVKGLGGNPAKIKPSQYGTANQIGAQVPAFPHHHHKDRIEHTGKVSGLRYDRFGDFEGFLLVTEAGDERSFRSQEQDIEEIVRKAWVERILMSVFVHHHDPHCPASIVLRRPPRLRA
jgi:hypothetical protein